MGSYKMPPTKGGYNFYECASALQKFIRRGMLDESLYFATEFYISGNATYVWNRLFVVCSEDIGLANNNAIVQINALYETYLRMKKQNNKHEPEKLPFTHAVMIAVKSKKSRLVDNLLCYYFHLRYKVTKKVLPDWIYDMHTLKGKRLGRGNDYFYEESAKIENWNKEDVPEEFKARDTVWQMYKEEDAAKSSTQEIQQPDLFDK